MTQSELKELTNLGAELGAAKAENEAMRAALEEVLAAAEGRHLRPWLAIEAARAALSQQPEPTDTFTAVDMATAAAQGFMDEQAAVEQAAAQDERNECRCTSERRLIGEGCRACNLDDDIHQLAFEVGDPAEDASGYWFDMESFNEFVQKLLPIIREPYEDVLRSLACTLGAGGYNALTVDPAVFEQKIRWGIDQLTRPAQTEQQPVGWIHEDELPEGYPYDAMFPFSKVDVVRMFPVYAPIAQTALAAKEA